MAFFASKLGENLKNMNRVFLEIKELFDAEKIENFERIPKDKAARAEVCQTVP